MKSEMDTERLVDVHFRHVDDNLREGTRTVRHLVELANRSTTGCHSIPHPEKGILKQHGPRISGGDVDVRVTLISPR